MCRHLLISSTGSGPDTTTRLLALASANSLVVVSGPLPVDEINKCLHIEGYCRRMLARLASLPHGKRLN